MGMSRRKHTREFKVEAVRQVVEKGRSVAEVADGLGINRNMLTRWKSGRKALLGVTGFNGMMSASDMPRAGTLVGPISEQIYMPSLWERYCSGVDRECGSCGASYDGELTARWKTLDAMEVSIRADPFRTSCLT